MKPPKKPFIVEFKPARRAHAKPQPSIWATIDLKASADELKPGSLKIDPQRSPKPVTPDAPEPAKAPRILPTLDLAPSSELMEIPLIAPEPDDVSEEIVLALGTSDVLATELVGASHEIPKTRLRRGNSEALPAGQRWKRRLPRILRQPARA